MFDRIGKGAVKRDGAHAAGKPKYIGAIASQIIALASRTMVRMLVGASVLLSFAVLGTSVAEAYSTPLTLQNGWTAQPFGTQQPGIEMLGDGTVTFTGAIATEGTNPVAFTLPADYRPSHAVYIPVDMCNATKGRLYIQPSGIVTVQAKDAFSNAQCFTSLDGATYVADGLSILVR
jgi:hypothetical protein